MTQNSLNSSSADKEPNDFWAKDLCSQDLFLEGTFGPEVTSASTRRGLITVLDQAEDLAENIPIPCKMFKTFQLNRRAASRWNATCEELEMVTGFEKVVAVTSATGCNSSFLLMWTIALEGTYPDGKQPRPQGAFPSGRTRLGGKLTCTITCVALFEAVGVPSDGPKSLSTSIKGEAVVRKTFLRNLATWKGCLGEVLDLLRWCEEVYEEILAGWGSLSNHGHLLYSISRISGCWWRLGWHVDKTTIRHSRSGGSSFSSLQFRRKSASFQVCWTAWIVGWEFYLLSPSSVVLDRLLLMPRQSNPILVTREAKWRLNFSGTWSKLMQNNQIVVEKQHLCFIEKKKYRKSFWEGRVVGTPNFAFCDSLPWLFDQSIFNSDPISKLC